MLLREARVEAVRLLTYQSAQDGFLITVGRTDGHHSVETHKGALHRCILGTSW
jgi:hypothetical protein